MHNPVLQELDGSKKIVIFIHGFMGSPIQFENLIETVHNADCSYCSILLPGHGSHMNEFAKSNMHKWEQHVQSEIDKIKNNYDEIYLFGHSMGGLLALNASLNKNNKIAGVFILQTPLKINTTNFKFLVPKLKLLFYPKNNVIKAVYTKSKGVDMSNIFLYPLMLKPTFSFYRLLNKTKKNLKDVFVPVYMIYSTKDETTSYKSLDLMCKSLYNTEKDSSTIYNSWHAYFPDDDWNIIAEKLSKFVK
ncbi:MAG: alpha/beta fold hydrolase [Oscillospiraceae bacterium]|nr:alpha/beta fold hydrolase [Oscillospiraceae bacterium]